jgi:hypothetical protein
MASSSQDQGLSQPQDEPKAQRLNETVSTDPSEGAVTPPAQARQSKQAVVPDHEPASTSPKGASQIQNPAQEPPPGTSAQSSVTPRPALASSQQPEQGAEVWSYPSIEQQSVRRRFIGTMDGLARAKSEFERYLVLNEAAKWAFVFGKVEDARAYASELLALDQKFQNEPWSSVHDGNHGVAVHDGNLVLGRIALQEGRKDEAKQYLLAAGNSTGAPELGSFGPNMSLARDLLLSGEQETVLKYFDLCSKFWRGGRKLPEWTTDVRAGRMPGFDGNLYN